MDMVHDDDIQQLMFFSQDCSGLYLKLFPDCFMCLFCGLEMDVVKVEDVQHLTFSRETEEVVQGFAPHITVPGFGTFTAISMEFCYRNCVDPSGHRILKVKPHLLITQ